MSRDNPTPTLEEILNPTKVDSEKIFLGIKRAIKDNPRNLEAYGDMLNLCKNEDRHDWNKELRQLIAKSPQSEEMWKIYKASLLFDAKDEFDSFCLYIELEREKKFYAPRRKQLKKIVDALQRLEDDEIDILCISCPPRIGKTTLALFYICWLAGRHPKESVLASSHSRSLLGDLYNECLRIMDINGEYLWHDVFPLSGVVRVNAQDMKIDIDHIRRFSTLQFGSVEQQLAGRCNASALLYCDDLVEGIEEAMSKERLAKKIRLYTVNLEQRKEASQDLGRMAKELHIATRWSVNDVIGHIQRREEDNPRAEFIVMSALDENDNSNFEYKNNLGFTTEMYRKMRQDFIDADEEMSWKAIYMNEPIEREGLLYDRDTLKRYDELPSSNPDGIVAIVDTKTTGKDYCFMPIAYVYGDEWYIEDLVLDNGEEQVIEERLVNKIIDNGVQMVDFESNSAGSVIASNVSKALKERGSRCTVKTHHTQANKETKIIVNAGWVKEHCLFKMDDGDKEYKKMLELLCSYVQMGKNKHDDVPDGFAQLSIFSQSRLNSKATVMKRIF